MMACREGFSKGLTLGLRLRAWDMGHRMIVGRAVFVLLHGEYYSEGARRAAINQGFRSRFTGACCRL